MRLKVIIPVVFTVMTTVVSAQDLTLPGDDFVPGWKKSLRALRFEESDLFNYINGGAELFHEFGFEELFVQRYTKDENEISLEVYRMESPESALGIYLMKCGFETQIPGIGARHTGNKLQFTIVKGDYFLQANNYNGDEALMPVMVSLCQQVLATISEGDPVELLEYLPEENFVPGSGLIIRGPYGLQPIYTFGEGDIFRLGGEVFGVVGDYRINGDVFSRIIIPYPKESQAKAAFRNLALNLDPFLEVLESWDTGIIFEDFQGKFGIVLLKNRTLEITINLKDNPAPQ
jgi:hypothetical protein